MATQFGCYTGANNGDSWTYSTSGIMAEDIYGVQFLGNSTLLPAPVSVYFSSKVPDGRKYFLLSDIPVRVLIRSDKAGVSYFQLAATGGGGGGQQIGQIYKSTDNGATWTIDTTGLSAVPALMGSYLRCSLPIGTDVSQLLIRAEQGRRCDCTQLILPGQSIQPVWDSSPPINSVKPQRRCIPTLQ